MPDINLTNNKEMITPYSENDNTIQPILEGNEKPQIEEYVEAPLEQPLRRKSTLIDSIKNMKYGELRENLKNIEFGETSYKQIEMPDDMVKLSMFMLVNQAMYKIQGKANWGSRLFIFALEAISIFTTFVQFYLLYLLWT